MATPHVSGVVALMQSYATTPLTPAQVEAALKSSARAFPVAPSQPIGAGIVDAHAAMLAARSGGIQPPTGNVAPKAAFNYTVSGLTAKFTDKSSDSDGSIASHSWKFGDGSTSTSTSPSHAYASAGTYTVSETVKDNAGASNTKSTSVTVGSAGTSTGGTVLSNGIAVTLPAVATGWTPTYSMVVPPGRSTLKFTISGGSGDADLYVRFGASPTATTYDCRPYRTGNGETCTFTAPKAGTWYVRARAYQAFSGVSLKGSY
jgi:serine protease